VPSTEVGGRLPHCTLAVLGHHRQQQCLVSIVRCSCCSCTWLPAGSQQQQRICSSAAHQLSQ
jgi:hypothetical protein